LMKMAGAQFETLKIFTILKK